MRRARSGNLTAWLVFVSVLEFMVNRLAGRLFFPRPALMTGGYGSFATQVVTKVGWWLFQLTALLGLSVMVAAFTGLFRRGELYPRAIKFSTIVIVLIFSGFCAWAVFSGQIDPRFFAFTQTGYAFIALLTAAAFALAPAPARLKIGVALFALPGALHSFGYVASRLTIEGRDRLVIVRRLLAPGGPGLIDAGEIALLIACILAPLL